MRKTDKKLTPKQMAFVREYLVDFNATQSALRAGYSKKGIRTTASDLLANQNIKIAIKEEQRQQAEGYALTKERVILELSRIAFNNPTDFMTWGEDERGVEVLKLKDSATLTDDQSACIQSIAQTNAGITIKLHDKLKALELLGRHLGIFSDKFNVNIKGEIKQSNEENFQITEEIISKNPHLIDIIFSQKKSLVEQPLMKK